MKYNLFTKAVLILIISTNVLLINYIMSSAKIEEEVEDRIKSNKNLENNRILLNNTEINSSLKVVKKKQSIDNNETN